jgi:hypothetical protein
MTVRSRLLRALAAVLPAILAAAPAHAQTKTGTTFGAFTMIEPGARGAGMGNAGVSIADGLQSVYFNPAAIGDLEKWEFQFSHAAWLADIRYDYVGAAIPLGGHGTAFASLTSLGSGDIDVRTVAQPLGTGERYSVSDVAIGLGYGRQISPRFSAGGRVNWVQESIWNTSASAWTFDIGTLYRVSPTGVHIGASLINFGTNASFSGRDLNITYDQDPTRYGDNGTLPGEKSTGAYPVPVLFRVGMAYPFRFGEDVKVWTALDAYHPSDNTESVSGGAEAVWRDAFALRAGYQNLFLQDSDLGLTLGAGFHGRLDTFAFRADYAWADHLRLEGTHRFTLGITF